MNDPHSLASLASQKEREWRDAVVLQTKALEESLQHKQHELERTLAQLGQLKEDFKVS